MFRILPVAMMSLLTSVGTPAETAESPLKNDRSMLTYRMCIAILLLLVTLSAGGEAISIEGISRQPQSYWVVGSYRNQQIALAQSEELSRDTGMDVMVAPASVAAEAVYRLVISAMEDAEGQQRQRAQLSSVGIEKPWLIRLDYLETMIYADYYDVELSPLKYIVLGSYEDRSEAELFATAMDEKIGLTSSIRSVEVNGKIYQRVLIGPYYSVDETQYTRRLVMDAGIEDSWILTESSTESSAESSNHASPDGKGVLKKNDRLMESTTTDLRAAQKQRDRPPKKPSDYSFSTLRPRTESNQFKATVDVKRKNSHQSGPLKPP